MSTFRVASRYAKSVFDLAVEMKLIDKVYQDMLLINQVCEQNRGLVLLLKNPIIRYDYKLNVLNKIFKKHTTELTQKFFALICRKNRANVLPDTSKLFVDQYHVYKGIVIADLTTAGKLSESLKKEFEDLVSKATGKKVELSTHMDESLIGGYVLKVGDNMIDNSLKNKLNVLRRSLTRRK